MALTASAMGVGYTGNGSNENPDGSLGGPHVNDDVSYAGVFLASDMPDARTVVFHTYAGNSAVDLTESYLVVGTGVGAGHVSRCHSYDYMTGTAIMIDAAPSPLVTGQIVRAYRYDGLWTTLDGSYPAGTKQYRGLGLFNGTGIKLLNHRVSVIPLDDAGIEVEIGVWNGNAAPPQMTQLSVETEEPDFATDLNEGAIVQRSLSTPIDGTLVESPPSGPRAAISGKITIWISRTVPAKRPKRDYAAYQIFHRFSNTGGDPDPFFFSWVAVFDIQGFTPQITFGPDRKVRENGGARYELRVTQQEDGQPASDLDVDFDKTVGGGTLTKRDQAERRTDELGRSYVNYSTAPETEGNTVTIRAKV